MSEAKLPRRLGRYELLGRIARGGMGTIYLARLTGEHRFEKRVAIKTLQEQASEDARFRAMFLDEMRIASRIDHPHVCSVIDAGSEGDTLFMVMEYCDGKTLSQIRRSLPHRLPYEFYVRVIADAARGLHAAHELRDNMGEPLGVVHRDVSPQNIMVLRRGGVKVLDFGIARARDRITSTRTGELKGKLTYMAPEQLRSDGVDRRADVWALGVVLWEMCFDYNPFDGGSPGVTVTNVTSAPLPDPQSLAADFPKPLAEVLDRTLVRDPGKRIPTAAALADALETCLYETGRPFGMQQVAEHVAPLWGSSADAVAPTEPAVEPDRLPVDPVHEQATAPLAEAAGAQAPGRRAISPARAVAGALAVTAAVVAAVAVSGGEQELPTKARAATEGERGPAVVDRSLQPTDPGPEPVRETDALSDASPAPEAPVVEPAEPDTMLAQDVGRAEQVRDAGPAQARTDVVPGFVSVFAVPIAEVWIDGRRFGETPLRRSVLPGRHRLTLRTDDGRTESRTVRIVPGRTERVSVEFGAPRRQE